MMITKKLSFFLPFAIGLTMMLTGCDNEQGNTQGNTFTIEEPSLYEAYEDAFLVGTALNRAQIYGDGEEIPEHTERRDLRGYNINWSVIPEPEGLQVATHHFNAMTNENILKWEEVHPEPGEYDFEAADRFVNIGVENDMEMLGHTLVWHNQTPDWVFEDEHGETISRDALIERMRDHIHTVVGRYEGQIQSWDVVNEALNEDGSFRETQWYEIIGEEYLVMAYEFAHEADPEAVLFYNDFNMEDSPEKRQGAIDLVEMLQENGAPIHGIGTQSHFDLDTFPGLDAVEQTLIDFGELDLERVDVTELDIDVIPRDGELDPFADGVPDDVLAEQTELYRNLFEIYLDHSDIVDRVTFWGVDDGGSWQNYFPEERTNYPLLFDRDYQPKPAYDAIMELAQQRL